MPGKFEGEPSYAEKLYELAMQGEQDETYLDEYDRQIDLWDINAIDADEMSEPDIEGKTVILWEDNNGFVYTKIFDSRNSAENYIKDSLGAEL